MKNLRFSTEAIVGIVAGIVIIIVLLYAFGKKREIVAIETQKLAENAYVDSMQNIIKRSNQYYRDTLSILDKEIVALKTEISNTRSKQAKYENYAKLDRMVSMSRFLIQENEALLIKLKDEPLKSEYTPQFLADLIEALIENIQIKEKKIIELQAEVNVLKDELESQKSLTQHVENQRNLAQEDAERKAKEADEKARLLAESEAAKEKLMLFQYILGSQKELLKEEVLTKRLLKKECYMANNILDNRFTSIQLTERKHKVVLGEVAANEVFCAPMLSGATTSVENGKLILHITNLNQLITNGRVVFYC
jgi:hypothetical protein